MWVKFLSHLEFNVETWLVGSISWISEGVFDVNLIGIRNLEVFVNWHFEFTGHDMLSTGWEWCGHFTTVGKSMLETPLEENRLFSDSKICFFVIVLDFGSLFISVDFTLPSETHVVLQAVWSEPYLSPLLVFPGDKTLSFGDFLITNVDYSSGSDIDIFLVN